MFDTSCRRRSTSEGILDVVSEQTKHTRIPFLGYEEILLCPFVLEYATLAINLLCFSTAISNSTRSTEKNKFYGRKPTHIHQSPQSPPDRATTISLNPPDRATTISCLIANGMNDRQICITNHIQKNLTLFMTFGFRRWSGKQRRREWYIMGRGGLWHAAGRFVL